MADDPRRIEAMRWYNDGLTYIRANVVPSAAKADTEPHCPKTDVRERELRVKSG
jgi:hypothetical protein